MNKILVLAAVGLSITLTACNKADLKSDKGQASYAIGQQIGKNLKSQNIEIDPKTLAASLADATAGKSEMTDEEIQKALMKLQELSMKKQQEETENNKKKSEEFLAKNKSAEGVKETASGLQYSVITEGTGATPKADDMVVCHYTGTLIDGTKFDSSVDRGEPAEFPVSGVIPGWTEALQMMKVGSKYKLFIPPDLAYGPQGRPGIPPNSTLIFEVELLDIVKAEPPAKASKARK
ncbi:FKBP-type peptidyl-prolyl cis-trans isomerase [Pseudobdellovibrio exovorus]|uniref:Peptidyl-prolyl cis-trans isomerase n=1 Tax=Pseudobdellovibrio exovorus JSS TaxID=1184267 RepID=M4V7H1_9BACT|nr:FKBP-type peptidyl-prolyl cis-trans isomerase [Pseudobdellovibrio exovorus]AGH95153.1 peptidyl-prolyl cis-trans isomerase, FKBP-type [Pseudobdellovibrio exovorus JSS]